MSVNVCNISRDIAGDSFGVNLGMPSVSAGISAAALYTDAVLQRYQIQQKQSEYHVPGATTSGVGIATPSEPLAKIGVPFDTHTDPIVALDTYAMQLHSQWHSTFDSTAQGPVLHGASADLVLKAPASIFAPSGTFVESPAPPSEPVLASSPSDLAYDLITSIDTAMNRL